MDDINNNEPKKVHYEKWMCNDADAAIFVNEANAAGQRSINTYSIRFRKMYFGFGAAAVMHFF